MKIRSGFVSNSSSASFIVVNKNKMTKEEIEWFRSQVPDHRKPYDLSESENFIEAYEIGSQYFVDSEHFKCNRDAVIKAYDDRAFPTSAKHLEEKYKSFL